MEEAFARQPAYAPLNLHAGKQSKGVTEKIQRHLHSVRYST